MLGPKMKLSVLRNAFKLLRHGTGLLLVAPLPEALFAAHVEKGGDAQEREYYCRSYEQAGRAGSKSRSRQDSQRRVGGAANDV